MLLFFVDGPLSHYYFGVLLFIPCPEAPRRLSTVCVGILKARLGGAWALVSLVLGHWSV